MYAATVSDFRLDKYEITVGRFRKFVDAGMGTQGTAPTSGTGANPNAPGTGWDATWNGNLKADQGALRTALTCGDIPTWTESVGADENRPIGCVSWYEAFAFCIWDGGRLPTEAEWNYAAAGGSEQRVYPWGPDIDESRASYYVDTTKKCYGDGVAGCTVADFIFVGTKPAGNGKWGHADLAGNVAEWNLDWGAPYSLPCTNCANTITDPAMTRVQRGGSAGDQVLYIRTSYRNYGQPTDRGPEQGARCSRSAP